MDNKSRSSRRSRRSAKSGRSRSRRYTKEKEMYGESFLDQLIDNICAPLINGANRDDDSYFYDSFDSFDDETFGTYETRSVEENIRELRSRNAARKKGGSGSSRGGGNDRDDDTYDEPTDGTRLDAKLSGRKGRKEERRGGGTAAGKERMVPYEDDATLESVDTTDQEKKAGGRVPPQGSIPLGLAPISEGHRGGDAAQGGGAADAEDLKPDPNLPISEFEYDHDKFDQGEVSVMESLGGPSLLIENQMARQAAAAQAAADAAAGGSGPPRVVSLDLIREYGAGYPGGEDAIRSNPDLFYRHVVQNLLEANEPEKVRLLDKLLAKYVNREEHLVTKLSVRYETAAEVIKAKKQLAQGPGQPGDQFETFGKAFPTSPGDGKTANAPGKEDVSDVSEREDEASYTSGEFSGESIDGTSPAVIAQVSELLNFVYGKTSVPGQIDRVSTIMRAYEGREAVLLELLETKALIKANSEGDGNMVDLPASLRNSPALAVNHAGGNADGRADELNTSEISDLDMKSPTARGDNTDDLIASMGADAPSVGDAAEMDARPDMRQAEETTDDKKKKKGKFFKKVFGNKKEKDKKARPQSSPKRNRPFGRPVSTEASI